VSRRPLIGLAASGAAVSLVKGVRASVTIQNLFDKDPAFALTGDGVFNGSYSNPFGRTYTAQLNAKF
jgi:outer membrane receptor protein involved in Fe transport